MLNRKAETVAARAKCPVNIAIEAAHYPGLETPDLEPLSGETIPRRGLARAADGIATRKPQRNLTDPAVISCRHVGYLQGYNFLRAVYGDNQMIVAVSFSN